MRDGFVIAGDDFALRDALREVIGRRNRLPSRRRDVACCRRDVRGWRIKAMGRGFEAGRHQWQKLGLRASLMADAFKSLPVASR